MDAAWVAGIALTIISALGGIIYWAGQTRDDKQDARHEKGEKALVDHSKEDVQAHERLRAAETEIVNLKARVAEVGKRVHDAREDFREAIAGVYKFIAEKILERFK